MTTPTRTRRSNMIPAMNASSLYLGVAAGLATCALVVACSSSTSDTPPATTAPSTAAAVAGAADTHCAGKPVVVASQAACHVEADAGHAGEDAGHTHDTDAGEADAGAPADEYPATLFGSEGDDDDCKYHVKWQATAVAVGSEVTFTVVATNRNDSSPVAGAKPYAEIFLSDTHPAPNTAVKTTETSPGTYTIGPVKFDAAGKWTVRFHFNDECTDSEESPHGHVAFFVNVP